MGCCASSSLPAWQVAHLPPLDRQAVLQEGTDILSYVNTNTRGGISIPNDCENARDLLKLEVRTIYDCFRSGLSLCPNGRAIGRRPGGRGEFEFITYSEMNRRIAHVASGLVEIGLRPGDRVGFYSKNNMEWQIAEQACYRQSFVTVSVYDTLGADAVQYICNHSEMSAMIVMADEPDVVGEDGTIKQKGVKPLSSLLSVLDQIPNLQTIIVIGTVDDITPQQRNACENARVQVMTFSELSGRGSANPHPENLPDTEDLAILMYTSGTTGTPKGVEILHRNLVAAIGGIMTNCPTFVPGEDVMLSYLPLAHIFARAAENAFLCCGAAIGYFSGSIPHVAEDIATLRPTVFFGVPRIYDRLFEKITAKVNEDGGLKAKLFNGGYQKKYAQLMSGAYEMGGQRTAPYNFEGFSTCCYDCMVFRKVRARLGGRVKWMLSGGGPLNPECHRFLRIAFVCPVVQGYGLTETCAGGTVQLVTDWADGHIGAPIGCCEIGLIDASAFGDFRLPEAGEICIRGPNVARGYYKEPEKTAEAFLDNGWFRTGDIGRVCENGTFRIVGRAKDIFKLSQGEYIAPEKIEGVFNQCELIAQSFVYGDSLKSTLVSVIVPSEDNIGPWLDARNIKYSRSECKVAVAIREAGDDLRTAIFNQMKAAAKEAKLNSLEMPKVLRLESELWTDDSGNGLLTPTQKPKRPKLTQKYRDWIDEMYAESEGGAASSSVRRNANVKPSASEKDTLLPK